MQSSIERKDSRLKNQQAQALTVKDARVALSISNTTIYKLIGAGKLKTFKIGRRRLIAASSIDALIEGEAS